MIDPRLFDLTPETDGWEWAVLMLAFFAFGLGIGWVVWS